MVLHGGGNTSVKTIYKDLFGKDIKVLCVKGSGWDLGTIEPEGHPAVELEPLLKLKKLSSLNDEDMVAIQRKNLINPKSPTELRLSLPLLFEPAVQNAQSLGVIL